MSALESLAKLPVIDALGWTLVHSLWEGFAVAIVAAIVLRAMRSRSAGARYLVGICALGIVALGALATFGLLNHEANARIPLPSDVAPVFLGARVPVRYVALNLDQLQPTMSWQQRLQPMLPWLVLAWAGGVAVLGMHQIAGWAMVVRLRRSGAVIEDACAVGAFRDLLDRLRIARPVRLARSSLVHVPSVIGWLRPVVLLPINALTGLTSDQLRGLLAHELAHVRRHDYLVNIVQTIVETLLFYHPAVWWMGRVIRQERENACDDLASAVCDRSTYAQALATMERLRQTPTLALSARGGALLPRIRRLLSPDFRSPTPRWSWATGLAILAIVIFTIVALQHRAKAADPKPASATQPATAPEFANASPPIPDDLVSKPEDYRIGKNDLVQISIMDLQGHGAETVKQARVSEKGMVRIPVVGEVPAAGRTEGELETATSKTFEDKGILKNAQVSVTVIEARARTFSILGAVKQPGQYAISKSDFRILDALVLARDTEGPVKSIYIIRHIPGEDENRTRNIEVALGPLKNGDLRQNVVIRPNDLIIVRPSTELSEVVPWRADALKNELNEVDRSIEEMSAILGENNPRIISLKAQREAMLTTIDELRASPGSQPAEPSEYYVGGDVPRTGVYSLGSRKITLKQALYAAGADLQKNRDRDVRVTRRIDDHQEEYHDFSVAELLDKNDSFYIQPRDVIDLRSAPHAVRLVVAPDRLTFQGREVSLAELENTLAAVPDRANTVLEVAVSTDDVTVGRLGVPMATASRLGFRYVSDIGVHPLGSKSGDDSPTTQPMDSKRAP